MKRRELLQSSIAFGLMNAVPVFGKYSLLSGLGDPTVGTQTPGPRRNALKPPATGSVPVAFVISDGAVVIDFAGPWEVFSDVTIGGRTDLFRPYTVAETLDPVHASGGMTIVPNYTLENAPEPKVIVIPAQNEPREAILDWIRNSSRSADVTMSVCTGAYVLALTGLLAGKTATTHHASYVDFATKFPDIQVKRGVRFVEDGNLASSGGLSCGIDLAFRVVERYYGREATKQVAYDMEYQGHGWLNADSNAAYAQVRTSAKNHPLCAVCSMDVDLAKDLKSTYRGKTYYFCSQDHKDQFDAAPAKFLTETK